jgi:hypothetical protein
VQGAILNLLQGPAATSSALTYIFIDPRPQRRAATSPTACWSCTSAKGRSETRRLAIELYSEPKARRYTGGRCSYRRFADREPGASRSQARKPIVHEGRRMAQPGEPPVACHCPSALPAVRRGPRDVRRRRSRRSARPLRVPLPAHALAMTSPIAAWRPRSRHRRIARPPHMRVVAATDRRFCFAPLSSRSAMSSGAHRSRARQAPLARVGGRPLPRRMLSDRASVFAAYGVRCDAARGGGRTL